MFRMYAFFSNSLPSVCVDRPACSSALINRAFECRKILQANAMTFHWIDDDKPTDFLKLVAICLSFSFGPGSIAAAGIGILTSIGSSWLGPENFEHLYCLSQMLGMKDL